MFNSLICPICNFELFSPIPDPTTRTSTVVCQRCGEFAITWEAVRYFSEIKHNDRSYIPIASHAIRRMNASDGDRFRVTEDWLVTAVANGRIPSPQEQADSLIEYLGKAGRMVGYWVRSHPQMLAGLVGTLDEATVTQTPGLAYVLDHLNKIGLIEQNPNPAERVLRLTFAGWAYFDELRRRSVDGPIAFMAMGYGDEEVDQAFSAFIGAVQQTGFELRRLDQKPKAGLIDLRMRVEIRTAKFLVADLTNENRGAYWEAGFAEGLDKKVYYTCEGSKFDKIKTHFDTEHLLTIKWNHDNISLALDELKSAIRNDFPEDAIQQD